jgi:glycerol-3-phosphate dehydrogenase
MAIKTDVLIIGGGATGASIARELSRYKINVLVVEKEPDFIFGMAKGTHSFIHCGLPGNNTPLMDELVFKGNSMFNEICEELDIPYKTIGKLLIALNEEEMTLLEKQKEVADKAGVPGLEIIDQKRLKEMEPQISDEVIGALYTPTTGIVSPWEYVLALIENAQFNGVKAKLDTEVLDISIKENDDFKFLVNTNKEDIKSRYIINCAGLYADKISSMIGENEFALKLIKEERYVLDEDVQICKHLVRSVKTGDFISPTKKEIHHEFSNILLGQTVEVVNSRSNTSTSREGINKIGTFARKIIPDLNMRDVIRGFAGIVPINKDANDYIIMPKKNEQDFINVVLAGGLGVSASPAVAKRVINILIEQGLTLKEKDNFKSSRSKIVEFRNLSREEKDEIIKKDERYGHVVCRCETVTEGEIVEAIKRGATTLDGVKFRTRAGMGRCQGGFCTPKVLKIMARELGVNVTELTKKGNKSELLPYKTKEIILKEEK